MGDGAVPAAQEAAAAAQAAQAAAKKKPRSKAGAAEAKAAATMTSEEWKKLQKGMAEKWPQPEYMNTPMPGRSHTAYRDETYAHVTRWTAETKISYRPHAKAPGSKSHVRYEEYSKATTVGEALELGTWAADWCWDYERGFIKAHGPFRDEPLDISKVQDTSTLTAVDWHIVYWYQKELAKKYGLNLKDLAVDKASAESVIMRAHRLVAQRGAKKRLEDAQAEGRRITDDEMLATLQEWAFARNPNRQNVIPDGQSWVWSDNLGLVRDRHGDIHLTPATVRYPDVIELIVRWMTDRLPSDVGKFKFTSLNLNCNYAARRHRDGNNFGPSVIAAFGKYTGGALEYWPDDDGSAALEDLKEEKSMPLKLDEGLVMFNGNCAHAVEAFEGERFSIVYFTAACHAKASKEDRAALEKLGFLYPSPDEDPHCLLRDPKTGGARLPATPAAPQPERLPAYHFWPRADLESKPFAAPKRSPAAGLGPTPEKLQAPGKRARAQSAEAEDAAVLKKKPAVSEKA